jgi:hypothetical protein
MWIACSKAAFALSKASAQVDPEASAMSISESAS